MTVDQTNFIQTQKTHIFCFRIGCKFDKNQKLKNALMKVIPCTDFHPVTLALSAFSRDNPF